MASLAPFCSLFSSPGVGELVDLDRMARRVAAGVVWGKRATRNAGLANGRSGRREQRASWRAEVRNMVAMAGGIVRRWLG